MTQITKNLREQLIKKGVNKKLASMIETLNEEIQNTGKTIKLEGSRLFICEKGKADVQVGDLKSKQAFVYDSKIFLGENNSAIQVFNSIFIQSYDELMTAFVPIVDLDERHRSVPVPVFKSFRVSFDRNGEVHEIALFNDRMETIAFASRISAES